VGGIIQNRRRKSTVWFGRATQRFILHISTCFYFFFLLESAMKALTTPLPRLCVLRIWGPTYLPPLLPHQKHLRHIVRQEVSLDKVLSFAVI